MRAYPTLIAFSGERELDRISGARPAAALLQWLADLRSGHTELDRLRAAPSDDLSTRLSLARTLVDKGLDEEALETFAWPWELCLEIDPAWVGVRGSFLIAALEPLLERSEKARQRFAQFRDAAARGDDRGALSDFVVLNEALGEDERTLEWLRAASPDQAAAMEIHRDHRILELIEEHGELALFGRLVKDPLAPL